MTNVKGANDHTTYTAADRWTILCQREHFIVAKIAGHQQHIGKRAHLKFTVDGDRWFSIGISFPVM